ncbi:putative nucleic-acid-binding Zn-ribbon protein [Oceanobacillus polygoni]|uniref:Nucleic-acid-binding Zn-ribbon protein n=1 Tax=Oceanobacillus polygoni TaxID=1235259 RepID=A0A9X1CA10_9BACI|nr:putative nucleic-acid-binding Zn-ribbon protein [Oceanobacillus polygoni]
MSQKVEEMNHEKFGIIICKKCGTEMESFHSQ